MRESKEEWMISKGLSYSSMSIEAQFTSPANTAERGPGLWHSGSREARQARSGFATVLD